MQKKKQKNRFPFAFIHITLVIAFFICISATVYASLVEKIPTQIDVIRRGLSLGTSPDFLDFGTAARGDVKGGNDITLLVESTEVDYNITMKGTDLTGVGVIEANAVEYRLEDGDWKKVTTVDKEVLSGAPTPEEENYLLNFRINVPSDASLGVHTGMLTVSLNTL